MELGDWEVICEAFKQLGYRLVFLNDSVVFFQHRILQYDSIKPSDVDTLIYIQFLRY